MKIETLISPNAEAVRALAAEGEEPARPGAGGAEGLGLLVLAALLSANPRRQEPIEDAFGGMVQDLAYAAAR